MCGARSKSTAPNSSAIMPSASCCSTAARDGRMLAAQPELRLDQLFPRVEIFFDLARENLAELGVDAADVGGQRLNRGQQHNHRDGQRAHGRLAFVDGRVRAFCRAEEAGCPILAALLRPGWETAAVGSAEIAARSISPCGNPSWPRSSRSRRAILPSSVS